MAGCSNGSIDGYSPKQPVAPDAHASVRTEDSPPVVRLRMGKDSFRSRYAKALERLPQAPVLSGVSFIDAPIGGALEALLDGTGIALSLPDAEARDRSMTILNMKGSLDFVVGRACSAARVYCSYRDGVLDVAEKETFVVALPPVTKEAKNTIADAVARLAGDEINVDADGGTLVYETDARGQDKVERYLATLREGRPLVVIQLYMWEVALDSTRKLGVNWREFRVPGIQLSKTGQAELTLGNGLAAVDRGISLGAVVTGRNIAADVLASFLATQGALHTVSNPQLTFVSGSQAEFSAGGKLRYVSEVGQMLATSPSPTTPVPGETGAIGTNTVQTDTIETGLKVVVDGAYDGNTIFANLDIEKIHLVSIDSVPTGGTTIQLPQTAEHKIKDTIRVRPGDSLVLAGLNSSRKTRSREGIPLDGKVAPLLQANDEQVSEFVVLVKPSVILFEDGDDGTPDGATPSAEGRAAQ